MILIKIIDIKSVIILSPPTQWTTIIHIIPLRYTDLMKSRTTFVHTRHLTHLIHTDQTHCIPQITPIYHPIFPIDRRQTIHSTQYPLNHLYSYHRNEKH